MIKNGEFCVYNGNEYELNEDNDGNLIIILYKSRNNRCNVC